MNRVRITSEERFLIDIFQRAENENFYLSYKTTVKNFISVIEFYLETSDFVNNTNNKDCFKQIYLSKENLTNTTIDSICKKLFVEEKTLYRQRKNYVKLINFFIRKFDIIFITDKKCL